MNKLQSIIKWLDAHFGNPNYSIKVRDRYLNKNLRFQIDFETTPRGLHVKFPGYSTMSGNPKNPLVVIEYREGVPHVVVWADIGQEVPSHIISLNGADTYLAQI